MQQILSHTLFCSVKYGAPEHVVYTFDGVICSLEWKKRVMDVICTASEWRPFSESFTCTLLARAYTREYLQSAMRFLFFFRSGCRKRSNARRCACRKTFPPLNGCASIQCSNWLPENKYLTSEYSDPGNWGHYKIATEAYDETFSAFCLCTVVYPGILWLLNNCAWASFTGEHCFYFLHIHYSNRTSILFLKLLFVYVASQ